MSSSTNQNAGETPVVTKDHTVPLTTDNLLQPASRQILKAARHVYRHRTCGHEIPDHILPNTLEQHNVPVKACPTCHYQRYHLEVPAESTERGNGVEIRPPEIPDLFDGVQIVEFVDLDIPNLPEVPEELGDLIYFDEIVDVVDIYDGLPLPELRRVPEKYRADFGDDVAAFRNAVDDETFTAALQAEMDEDEDFGMEEEVEGVPVERREDGEENGERDASTDASQQVPQTSEAALASPDARRAQWRLREHFT